VGVRLNKYLWLNAGAGATGFRSLQVSNDGLELHTDIKSSPVFMISLQFRPVFNKDDVNSKK
jgi:hypothetical protein